MGDMALATPNAKVPVSAATANGIPTPKEDASNDKTARNRHKDEAGHDIAF